MADPRREFRIGCYIFSLDRIPRHIEEMTVEEWAYYLQNHIPISRGLAQVMEGWRIPFPTIMPHRSLAHCALLDNLHNTIQWAAILHTTPGALPSWVAASISRYNLSR